MLQFGQIFLCFLKLISEIQQLEMMMKITFDTDSASSCCERKPSSVSDNVRSNRDILCKVCPSTVISRSFVPFGYSCSLSWNLGIVLHVQVCDEMCAAVGYKGSIVIKDSILVITV